MRDCIILVLLLVYLQLGALALSKTSKKYSLHPSDPLMIVIKGVYHVCG